MALDIKAEIEKLVDKIQKDPKLMEQFKTEPVKAVEMAAEKKSTPKAPAKKTGAKTATRKQPVPTIAIQSLLGGTITTEEIVSKVKAVAPDATEIYVKSEENKAYWIRKCLADDNGL